MPSQVMTTTQVDHPINLHYQAKVLTRVIAKFLYAQWGQNYSIPQHAGATNKWRRWSNLLAQTTPLTEAEDPTPILISKTDLTVSVREYGAAIKVSSWMKFTGLNSDQDNMANVLLDNMRLTLDTLARDVCVGTASRTTAASGSPTTTYINKTDIDTIVTNLEGQNAMMLTSPILAGRGVGTSPIRAAYIGIGHTAQRPRLQAVAGFKHTSSYPRNDPIMYGEFCSTGDVRWLLTTNATVSGSNYDNVILGKEFFGNTKIEGNSADRPLIFTPADRTGSPLQRYSFLGWLQNYAARILNDNFGHVLRTTV